MKKLHFFIIILFIIFFAGCSSKENTNSVRVITNAYSEQNIKPLEISDSSDVGSINITSPLGSNNFCELKNQKLTISYDNGLNTVSVPFAFYDQEHISGIFISKEKTAIAYGSSSETYIMVSDDMGKSWNTYILKNNNWVDHKYIGFTSDKNGWLVLTGSIGAGMQQHYVYQTDDGGETWHEIPDKDVYHAVLTGAGFSTTDIGFITYRYSDFTADICWTKDRGKNWTMLDVKLPTKYKDYCKTPLSPQFLNTEGRIEIQLYKDASYTGSIYIVTNDYGLTWKYDESLDNIK